MTIDFTFQIDIGDDVTPAQAAQWAAKFRGYQETVPDPERPGQTIPNPQNRGDFLRDQLADVAIEWMTTQRRHEAREAAAAEVPDDIKRRRE